MGTMKIAIIGLGLIGGSMAKAIKENTSHTVYGYDKNDTVEKKALLLGAIDEVLTDEILSQCDLTLIALYPQAAVDFIRKNQEIFKKSSIVLDCCGVKRIVCRQVEPIALKQGFVFIGGHPMAGSEKSGYSNAKAMLIENAYYVLTPTSKVPQEKIDNYVNFVRDLRAIPIILDYQEHDQVTGTISHLPHIIASSLVNFVRDTDTKDELMKNLAAGGFKDITRIASSSPTMWQHICLKNKENISRILDAYIQALGKAKELIDQEDEQGLYSLFDSSRNYRNSIPGSSAGPIKKAFAVYCDIIDEAGGIAAIATILASNNLNIKNIGIVHNREFEEGVLRIEFYDEGSSKRAAELLQKFRYIVYER